MATLPERVSSLEVRIDLLRKEIKEDITSLRQELKAGMAALGGRLQEQMTPLRQELKGDINTALNRLMLYFSALAVILALLTLWR